MTFREGLYRARSHIVFILALITAFSLVIGLEQWDPDFGLPEVKPSPDIPKGEIAPLSEQERQWAKIAWTYFEVHTHPETGLVDAVAGSPVISMADVGAYLMAVISAHRLQVIPDTTFNQRIDQVLKTLAAMPFPSQTLPNRYYTTTDLRPVDARGYPAPKGIGWSGLEMAQLLVPLQMLVWRHPEFTPSIRRIVGRWRLADLVKDGVLYREQKGPDGEPKYTSEGRIGYDEYLARAVSLMGLDAFMARQYRDLLQWETVLGIKIPTDKRGAADIWDYGTTSSDPYILHGLEFGWGVISKELAYRIYRAQEIRYRETGQKTAVGIGYIDRAGERVAYAVYAQNRKWVCMTASGEMPDTNKTVDLAVAFGWYALYRTPYTKKLIDDLAPLHDAKAGWYAGRYETDQSPNKALTCRTNALVLEALCYKSQGPLFVLNKVSQ